MRSFNASPKRTHELFCPPFLSFCYVTPGTEITDYSWWVRALGAGEQQQFTSFLSSLMLYLIFDVSSFYNNEI
jgi:hypothetical protein